MNFGELSKLLYDHPVLALAIVAILSSVLGLRLRNSSPGIARLMGNAGYIGMAGALLLTVAQTAQLASRSDAALLLGRHPKLTVRGVETVVPMASDGHYWVEATVNGEPGWFLIDTGASYTGLAPDFAEVAGVTPDPLKMPVDLSTANGTITARLGNISELRFGNVAVTDLEAAISPVPNEDTNIIGMNLLSQLASWRVEGDALVLVPNG